MLADRGGDHGSAGPVLARTESLAVGAFGRLADEFPRLAQPAADDENGGIEDRREIREHLAHPPARLLEQLKREGVPGLGRLGDVAVPDAAWCTVAKGEQAARPFRVSGGPLPRAAGVGRTAGVLLHAAGLAAAAGQPAGDGPVVPDLAGHAEPAAEQLPAADDAGPEPCAERDHYHVIAARPRAVHEFAPGGRVGVVLHHRGQPGGLLDQRPDGLVAPADVGAETHRGAVLVDVSGGADSDGLRLAAAPAGIRDRTGDRGHDPVRVGRGGDAHMRDNLAPGIDDADGDLGAAQVDADGQAFRQRGIHAALLSAVAECPLHST